MNARRSLPLRAAAVTLAMLVFAPPTLVAQSDDCRALEKELHEIERSIKDQEAELNKQIRRLDEAAKAMEKDLDAIKDDERKLEGEPEKVRSEMVSHGISDVGKGVAKAVATAIAFAVVAPELLGESALHLAELAHQAHTAYEMYKTGREAGESFSEADAILGEVTAGMGGLEEALAYANEKGLTELAYMIRLEMDIRDHQKAYREHYADYQDAMDGIHASELVLDDLRRKLQAVADALYDCLARNADTPCTQAINPDGGAGVCR